MKWRKGTFLLSIILLCACGGDMAAQAGSLPSHASGQPSMSLTYSPHAVPLAPATSDYVLTAENSGPVLATTSALLSQERNRGLWQSTVILSQTTGKECPGSVSDYWLETTSPDQAIRASSVNRVGTDGPCRVTMAFEGLSKVPESAVLVLDEAGVLSSAQLTLVRFVTPYEYYWIPICCGLGAALALLLAVGLLIGIRGEDGTRKKIFNREFRKKTVPESRVPKVVAIPIATIIATFLGVGTLASSLFPGISISTFLAMTVFVEALMGLIGTAIYTILYLRWVGRCSPDELGRPLALPSGGTQQTTLSFPGGADITSARTMSYSLVTQPDQPIGAVHPPNSIEIPNNTRIEIDRGELVSFPDGPNIRLAGAFSLQLLNDTDGAGLSISTGGSQRLPLIMTTDADTTISYNNVAEFHSRNAKFGSKIGNRRMSDRSFTLTPGHPTEPSVSMSVLLTPMLASALAVGAELGVIAMLSIWLSGATWFGQFVAFDLIVIIAIFALYYVVTRFRYATDPDSRVRTAQISAGADQGALNK